MKLAIIAFSLLPAMALADSSAVSGSSSTSQAGAAAIAAQQQGQLQGNSQHLTVNGSPIPDSVTYHGGYEVRNVPNVIFGGPASGPCTGVSGGLGVAVPGLGVGVNGATVDDGCAMRETARVAFMIGRPDIANAVLENMDIVKEALAAKNKPVAAKSTDAKSANAKPAEAKLSGSTPIYNPGK